MTPTEVAENLETEAKNFDDFAERFKNCNQDDRANQCQENAKNARLLATKIRCDDKEVQVELNELQRLINECQDKGYAKNDTCKSLKKIIEKFRFNDKKPYSDHLKKCGY